MRSSRRSILLAAICAFLAGAPRVEAGGAEVCPADLALGAPIPAEIVVPIEMRDLAPFDEFGFDLDYDENVLQFVECRRSPFTAACPSPGDPGCFDDLSCFDSPGTVRIGGFSASGPETPGSLEILCEVVFTRLDTTATSTSLTARSFSDDFAALGLPDCTGTLTFLITPPAVCPLDISQPVPAPAGHEIVVDVEMRDVPSFDEFGFDFEYDALALEFVECRRSAFTQTCPNPGDPGCFDDLSCFESLGSVRVGGFSSSGNETPSSPEVLCQLVFRSIDPNASSASLTARNFFDDFADFGVPDCGGAITLEPEGTGDVNDSGTLTPSDALCAFRCFLSFGDISIPPFSLCDAGTGVELHRADADCDGNCSVADADYIFDRWIGCGGAPSHCFAKDGTVCPQPGLRAGPVVAAWRFARRAPLVRGEIGRVSLEVRGTGALRRFGLDVVPGDGLEILDFEPLDPASWGGFGAGLHFPGIARLGGFAGASDLRRGDWTSVGELVVRVANDAPSSGEIVLLQAMGDLDGASFAGDRFGIVTGASAPGGLALGAARPNPTSGSVRIDYSTPTPNATPVVIRVYDVRGRVIRTLVDAKREGGTHEVSWSGEDDAGRRVAAGTYFLRMTAGEFVATRKIVLAR